MSRPPVLPLNDMDWQRTLERGRNRRAALEVARTEVPKTADNLYVTADYRNAGRLDAVLAAAKELERWLNGEDE